MAELANFVSTYIGDVVCDPDFGHVSTSMRQQIQHLLLLVNLSTKYSKNIQFIIDEHSKIKVSKGSKHLYPFIKLLFLAKSGEWSDLLG